MFLAATEQEDRRPVIACDNGDTVCADCFKKLQISDDPTCPTCDGSLLSKPILNKTLLEMIQTYASVLDRVPEISVEEMEVSEKPFAKGAFGKIYDAKWHNQHVVIKVLTSADISEQLKEIKHEANLAIGLLHPNVIRLYGTTWVKEKYVGIVMEKAEHGSLDKWIGQMDNEKTAKIALGIVNGLDYMHSRNVVHRDIKPQNILMCGSQDDVIPKIADFGVSKVIQSVTMHTMAGTMLYMAPEVRTFSTYGNSADIFSLAMMLFEMFSGHPRAENISQPLMKAMMAVIEGKCSKIPVGFPVPACLHGVIERGWNKDPDVRPALSEYRSAMKTLIREEPESPVPRIVQRNVTRKQQAQEMACVNIAVPIQAMSWSSSCEVLNSRELRFKMIDDIKAKSNMKSMIHESVLNAMKVVPRHLFIEASRLGGASSRQDVVNTAYVYCKPIPATAKSNESSPEIIGTQLSMTEIIQGQSVLLVGVKGGYIQSLIAQLVGINGSTVTVTAEEASMSVCRDRVNQHCPFDSNVDWVKVCNMADRSGIVEQLKRRKQMFHTNHLLRLGGGLSVGMKELLHDVGNVSIMAPVKSGEDTRFQLYLRRGKETELRTVTDFGVIFEDAH